MSRRHLPLYRPGVRLARSAAARQTDGLLNRRSAHKRPKFRLRHRWPSFSRWPSSMTYQRRRRINHPRVVTNPRRHQGSAPFPVVAWWPPRKLHNGGTHQCRSEGILGCRAFHCLATSMLLQDAVVPVPFGFHVMNFAIHQHL